MKNHLFKLTALSLLSYGMGVHAETAVNIQILSATVKDQKIDNARVILQKNGEQSVTVSTDAQGQVSLKSAITDDATALLIVKKQGYSDLVVKCPCAGMTYAISPVMKGLDGLRIVLNWGANPLDLDSHIVYPNNHVYFESMKGTDALLDVDDTTSFGPETITIERKHDNERYVYAVHNYSEGSNPNSTSLSASQAKVFVYVGQTLIKTYYVPQNKVGNLWAVFAVTETGEFQDFNTIKGVTSEKRLQTDEFQGIANNATVETVVYSADSQTNAKELNKQGEQAYHAKNYDEAIRLYKAAIDLDGNYGQAYSNLGLAFQKVGNNSEALWANRKAIALATGDTAAAVRASSHYNNGKIYEDAKQWDDALREYHYAKREKENDVYDKAIQRMQKQGAK
ncbi:MAG: tetratricopeptide repeat protein [Methylococcales bacterium]|nr:tetratricopeptide repeat protein [Methylococcales bacterium]